jgi:histidine triad (HIT) family protein
MNATCVFCAIAAGEPITGVVAQDAHTITLLDFGEYHHGHLLLAPRHHYTDVRNMDEAAIDGVIQAVKRAVYCIDREFPGDGICVRQSTPHPSTPDIMHTHFHIHPRHATPLPADRHAIADGDSSTTSPPAFIERLRRHMLDMQIIVDDEVARLPASDEHQGVTRHGHATSVLWCGCSKRTTEAAA